MDIQKGLPVEFCAQAGSILQEAFSQKLSVIICDAGKAGQVINGSIDPQMCFSAFGKEELYGLAGMQIGQRRFLNARWNACRSVLGFWPGLYAFLLFHLFYGKENPNEIYIDVAAVKPEWRGHGIGAQLLGKIADYGRELGMRAISLDVVNTNHGAYRLYERMGFLPVKKIRYPIPEKLVGFTASTIMRKPL
jgi:ribosomal protein S18 acetylase RimI-like enzyme